MLLNGKSFTLVMLGDWNKLYVQPEWFAQNIFGVNEIDVRINGQGTDYELSYAKNSVVVTPTQNRVMFMLDEITDESLEFLATIANGFMEKAVTPSFSAFGINCSFIDEDNCFFINEFDKMSDVSEILDNGFEIISTSLERQLKKDNKIINIKVIQNNSKTELNYNEHHDCKRIDINDIRFTKEMFNEFIEECRSLSNEFVVEE